MATLTTDSEKRANFLNQAAWRAEGWLNRFRHLNRSTVLDYFKHSDFYDKTCNNEIAIMQNLSAESLKSMEGIEYEVDGMSTDDLFLIRKSYRTDPQTTQLLALYLVVGVANTPDPQMPPWGTVIPMPDLHSVLRNNLTTGLHYLKSALDDFNTHLNFHGGVHGYQWEFPDESPDAAAASDSADAKSKLSEKERAAQKEGGEAASAAASSSVPLSSSVVAASKAAAAAASAMTVTPSSAVQQRHAFTSMIDAAIQNLALQQQQAAQQQQPR